MEFVELGQIDSVAGPVAGAFHSPKVSEGADRRVHAGLDLDQDEVRLQLVERWRSRHAVEDVHFATVGLHLDARITPWVPAARPPTMT